MDQSQLRQQLEQLHAELEHADSVDPETREQLRDLQGHIEHLLASPAPDRARQYPSFRKRVDDAIVQFEATHPELTIALGKVADSLAQLGF